MRARFVLGFLLGATLAVSVVGVPALATSASNGADVTSSSLGQKLLNQAMGRFAGHGYASTNLRVWHDSLGYLVADASTPMLKNVVTTKSGNRKITLVPTTPVARPAMAAHKHRNGHSGGTASALSGPSWSQVGNACFSRISDTWTWMDHCYLMYKLASDGNGSTDYYALDHFASFGPNWPWALNSANINASAIGSTAQHWMDWSPRTNRTGNCTSGSVSVAVQGVSVTDNVEKCEEWDFAKANPAVSYGLGWYGGGMTRSNRELAFEIAVYVNQGAWPQWSLPADVHGDPI